MNKIIFPIKKELDGFENSLKEVILKENNFLTYDLEKFIFTNPKRLRPIFIFLFAKILKIENPLVMDIALITELIHNASLIHDDIIDEEKVRRNNPTFYEKYGSKLAVLEGDLLLSLALECLSKTTLDISQIFAKRIKKTILGEISQNENLDKMIDVESYDNLRYSKRDDDPLIIVNKGPKSKGFMVCKECGAAVPGDDSVPLSKMLKPFVHPHNKFDCRHSASQITNTYLGSQFRTDMVVYEIALPYDKVNVDAKELWIHRAGQTLAEAMTLAGGRLLDIEFNEIKSGYRLRYNNAQEKAFVDVFLFDSLSSGAGYCSTLADRTEELMDEIRKVLSECPAKCDSACHECLMHFWNQRVHNNLDRFAALQLLDWCQNSILPEPLSYEEQDKLLLPLNSLGSDYRIDTDGQHHFLIRDGIPHKIAVSPSMWSKRYYKIAANTITVSDKLLKYALPKADSIIREQF